MTTLSAREEWAAKWPLPIIGMLGVSGCAIFTYSSGVFMEPVITELGWSRTEFAAAFVIQMAAGLLILPTTGWLADRFGPRRILLIGIIPFALAFASLGLVGKPIWQWWAMCLLVAVAQGMITQPIWVAAVIGHFKASRGMAMAVALSGLGFGSVVWPLLTAICIGQFGWRVAYLAVGMTWAVVLLPLTIFVFRDPPRPPAGARVKTGLKDYGGALKSRTFLGIMVAGGLFSSSCLGISVNLVPILKTSLGLTVAAGVVGFYGVSAIVGRLVLGHMLDRYPTRPLAIVVFLLPAVTCLLLLFVGEAMTVPIAMAAAIILGFAGGAEMDIITFVAARRFGQQLFGSIYALFTAILALATSIGPLIAGMFYDHFGTYASFLIAVLPLYATAAAVMAWIPMSSENADDEAIPVQEATA